MKKLSVYTIITAVLLLVGAGIWQGCKPKGEEDPSNLGGNDNPIQEATYFTTTFNCEDELTKLPGVLIVTLGVFNYKDLTTANLSGAYISLTKSSPQEMDRIFDAVAKSVNSNSPELYKHSSLPAYIVAKLKETSAFGDAYPIKQQQIIDLLTEKSVELASLKHQRSLDSWSALADASINFFSQIIATPAYARPRTRTRVISYGRYTSRTRFRAPTEEQRRNIEIENRCNRQGDCPPEIYGLPSYHPSQAAGGGGEATASSGIGAIHENVGRIAGRAAGILGNLGNGDTTNVSNEVEGAKDDLNAAVDAAQNSNAATQQELAWYERLWQWILSWGDPHLITLDKVKYDFQAMGEFIAAKSTTDKFEVQVRYGAIGESAVTFNRAMAIHTDTDIISYDLGKTYLYINKQKVSLAQTSDKGYMLPGGGNISSVGSSVMITTANGDLIGWRSNTMYFRPNDNRKGKLVGLLGNFDGNLSNDGRTRDNKAVNLQRPDELYPTYADSWRISQSESLFFYENGTTTETYTDRTKPNNKQPFNSLSLAERQKAEGICRQAGVNREPELCNCILDVAITGDASYANLASLVAKTIPTDNNFLSLAPYSGKSSEGAVAVTVDNKIYAGLGTRQMDWAMYDPATDKWTMKAPFSAGKTSFVRMGTFVIDKKVYCVGGWIDQTATNSLWEYDTDTDKWTKRKDLPGTARYNIAAFATGGKGYALFGTIGWGLSENDYPTKGTLYEYDPATDNWTTKADFPAKPRGNNITNGEFNGLVMNINGRIFVGNGSGSGTVWSDWYEYIPTRDAWEKRANSFGGTYYFSVGNIGYVLNHGARSYVMTYDATTDTWSKWPGKEIFIPLQRNVARGVYQAPTLNGKSYLGLGNEIKDWWSFTP